MMSSLCCKIVLRILLKCPKKSHGLSDSLVGLYFFGHLQNLEAFYIDFAHIGLDMMFLFLIESLLNTLK